MSLVRGGPPVKVTREGLVPNSSPGPPLTETEPPPLETLAIAFSAAATSAALALKAMSAVSETPGPPSPKLSRYWPPVALTVIRCTSLASGSLSSLTSKEGAADADPTERQRKAVVRPIVVMNRLALLLSLLTSDLPARGRPACCACLASWVCSFSLGGRGVFPRGRLFRRALLFGFLSGLWLGFVLPWPLRGVPAFAASPPLGGPPASPWHSSP